MKRFILPASLFILSVFVMFLPNLRLASARTSLVNPLEFIGIRSPEDLVKYVLIGFAMVAGTFAIAFTVFNGFKMIIATDEEAIKTARQSLTWSAGGFIVILLTFTIISGTANFLGFDPTKIQSNPDKITNPVPGDFLLDIVELLMKNFLGILGVAAILMVIYYGYRYITSAGNEEAVEQAKSGLKWAISGFAVSILAYTIISSLQRLLTQGPPP